ncbi:MAG: hypothetical protein LQ351_000018 [Letrouitia transgressa]|nr:MAG: hypothetical protein LQ351_000018 [Letrouitia transgressa]
MLLTVFILPVVLPALTTSTPISLQWAICDTSPSTVLRKLSYTPTPTPHKLQNITYFDLSTPNYTAQGLAFRTKLHKHVPISMVKARFADESDDVSEGAKCKWDRYGNRSWFTCGVSSPLVEGKGLWSAEQVSFAERYFPSIQWDRLVPYGPFLNPKWKIKISGRKAVFDSVEAVIAGQVVHLMEVEVKVKENEVGKEGGLYEAITRVLADARVIICGPTQLPKTLRLFKALQWGEEGEEEGEEEGFGEDKQRPLI